MTNEKKCVMMQAFGALIGSYKRFELTEEYLDVNDKVRTVKHVLHAREGETLLRLAMWGEPADAPATRD